MNCIHFLTKIFLILKAFCSLTCWFLMFLVFRKLSLRDIQSFNILLFQFPECFLLSPVAGLHLNLGSLETFPDSSHQDQEETQASSSQTKIKIYLQSFQNKRGKYSFIKVASAFKFFITMLKKPAPASKVFRNLVFLGWKSFCLGVSCWQDAECSSELRIIAPLQSL